MLRGLGGACTHCGGVAVADELHTIFQWPALQPVRQQYAPASRRSFFAQQDRMQFFKLVLSHEQHIRYPPVNTQTQEYLVHSTAGHSGLTSQTNFTWLIT